MNANRLKKSKAAGDIDIVGNLMRCYDFVPNLYFDERFIFNFEYLTKDRSKVLNAQDDVSLLNINVYFMD